jgi:hypothetical protein
MGEKSHRRYIIFKFAALGGGGIIFVPSAKKWGRIFVPGDICANIDKIGDFLEYSLNF